MANRMQVIFRQVLLVTILCMSFDSYSQTSVRKSTVTQGIAPTKRCDSCKDAPYRAKCGGTPGGPACPRCLKNDLDCHWGPRRTPGPVPGKWTKAAKLSRYLEARSRVISQPNVSSPHCDAPLFGDSKPRAQTNSSSSTDQLAEKEVPCVAAASDAVAESPKCRTRYDSVRDTYILETAPVSLTAAAGPRERLQGSTICSTRVLGPPGLWRRD